MLENPAHKFQAIQKQLADADHNYRVALSDFRGEEKESLKQKEFILRELSEGEGKAQESISSYQADKQRRTDGLMKFRREYTSLLEQAYTEKYTVKQKWYRHKINYYDNLVGECATLLKNREKADKALSDFKPIYNREVAKYEPVVDNVKQKSAIQKRLVDEAIEQEHKLKEKHPWYGKHTRVYTKKRDGVWEVIFENEPNTGGFTRMMLKLYEAFHAMPEKKRLLHATQAFAKAKGEFEQAHLEFTKADGTFTPILDKHTKLLNETSRANDDFEAYLKKHPEIEKVDFTENSDAYRAKYAYLEQPYSREIIIEKIEPLTIEERKAQWHALSKKITDCPEFFVKEFCPQGDVYIDAQAIKEFDASVQTAIERLQVFTDNQINGKQEELTALSQKRPQTIQQASKQAEAIQAKTASTAKEYAAMVDLLSAEILRIAQSDPVLYPLFPQGELSPELAKSYVESIAAAAQNRVLAPALPMGGTRRVDTEYGAFPFPQYKEWQMPGETKCNFVIDYDKTQEQAAIATMNNLLINMLLVFPVKKLRFTFVDLNISNAASLFTVQLDGQLYHGNPVVKEQDLRKQLEEMQDRMVAVSKHCNNLLEYNEKNNTFLFPYEVIVLLDYPCNLSPQTINQLRPLCQNGYKGGLFFVVMRSKSTPTGQQLPTSIPELISPEYFQTVPLDEKITADTNGKNNTPRYIPIVQQKPLLRECIDYINRQAQEKETIRVVAQSMENVYRAALRDASDAFQVPVGEQNGRPTYFELNQVNHFHTFVMGKSGAGKSVFLHNIITNAILTYSPESLQLYLLDFKSGGVEFNRYRDVKHIKALLVDDSDFHITLEILRDLHDSMRERAKKLRDAGVNSLQDYNQAHPETKLPRIVLVVDECHQLFADRHTRSQNEINAIVTKISKEGRNQGVHLIFATQTLANANIPSDILNNISDHFLMMCAATDAEKLVRESSKLTEMLYTGSVLYCHADQRNMFQAYFSDTSQREENISQAMKKSAAFPDENRFFFNGKQVFSLDQQVVQWNT